MKAVHFGAGNIGRGFIGLLLSKAGYDVVFVDVNDELVSLLQEKMSYTVTLANEAGDSETVSHVTAINGKNVDQAAEAVASADIVTTAVGVNVLKFIAEPIAKGIERRLQSGAAPLVVIACENAIGGSTQLKEHVYGHLSAESRERAEKAAAFPDAAVDRIVPLQHHEDPLQVTVEPFYEWAVDRTALPQGHKEIPGIHYTDNLESYIERKLFTVNTGHCTAAYHGYLRGFKTIQQAMADEGVRAKVRGVLEETGAMLVQKYGFGREEHARYIDKILERFTNPYLTDEVVRVGRSPIRKLSANDRLVRPALLASEQGAEVVHLPLAMAAALHFDYAEDPEAVQIQTDLRELGIGKTVSKYTGIANDHPIHRRIVADYKELEKRS